MKEQKDKTRIQYTAEEIASQKNWEQLRKHEDERMLQKFRDFLSSLDSDSMLSIALTYLYDERGLIDIMSSVIEVDLKKKILLDYESQNEGHIDSEIISNKQAVENSQQEINDEKIGQKFKQLLLLLESDSLIYVVLEYFYDEDGLRKLLDNDLDRYTKVKIMLLEKLEIISSIANLKLGDNH